MAVAVQDFITLSGTAYDTLDWSSGQTRIIKDNVSGDLLVWKWKSGDNKMPLYSSQDNGATWSLVVSDASGASGSQPNWIQSVWQDTTNGNVHCVSSSSSNVYAYTRFALTRSGGHVTGYSIDRAAYSLPTHSFDASSDRRADIKTVTNGGVEQVVICFQGGTTAGPNTDLRVYMCIMSSLTGSSTSTGLLTTGTDTQVYSHTTGGNIANHVFQALLVQEKTSETVYCVVGKFNTDYAESFSASSDWDLFAIPFTPVAGTWVQQTAVPVHSIPGGGSTPPDLLSVSGAAGVASIMYYGENGIGFAKFDASGTLTDRYVTEPYTTGTRCGFGSHTTDGTNILCMYGTYGSVGGSPASASGYWNGSAWVITALSTGGAEAWFNYQHDGSSPLQHFGMWGKGSTLAQTRTADAIAGTWTYTLDQNAFRARNDDGSETTATWVASQSTNPTAPKDTNLRLRYMLDAAGLAPSNTYQLEYKLSTDTNYLKVPLDSSSNIASVGTMGTGTSSTSTTTIVTTTATNALAIGDTGIIIISADNTSTTDGDHSEVTGVVDSAGNTWTKLAEYTNSQSSAAAGATVSVWMCYASVAVPIGSTVTATFGSARVDKTTSIWKFTSNRKLQQSTTATHATTAAANGFGSNTFSGLPSKQRLYIMGGSKEANSTTALTPSTSFTVTTPQRSRNNASAIMTRGEFRVNTSTGETSNPTLAVSGFAVSVFIALEETPPPITMSASSNITASAATATTSQLTGGSGSFTAGRISDDTNPMPAITIGSGGNSEFEWCVQALSANGVADAQVYNLRVTNNGTILDTYTNSLAWTIGSSGGNVYNVTLSESGSASDALTSAWSGSSALSESGTATSTFSTAASLLAAIAETITAADTQTSGIASSQSLTEAASAADASTAAMQLPSAITEAGTAADVVAAIQLFAATINEAVTASDALTTAANALAALTESATGDDVVTNILQAQAAQSESGTAADSISNGQSQSASLAETASAADVNAATLTQNDGITEAGSASDALSSAFVANSAITESGSSADSLSSTGAVYSQSIAETGTAADTVAANQIAAAGVNESLSAADVIASAAAFVSALTEAITATEIVSWSGAVYSVDIAETATLSDLLASAQQLAATVVETQSSSDVIAAIQNLQSALSESANSIDALSSGGSIAAAIVEAATAADAYSIFNQFDLPPLTRIGAVPMRQRVSAIPLSTNRFIVVRWQQRVIH